MWPFRTTSSSTPSRSAAPFMAVSRSPWVQHRSTPSPTYLVSIVHGAAHTGAHVPFARAANLFVFIVILAEGWHGRCLRVMTGRFRVDVEAAVERLPLSIAPEVILRISTPNQGDDHVPE